MKQVTFSSGSIVTGTAVASALLEYLPELTRVGKSHAVEIPVYESDGTISRHCILLTPSTTVDVADHDDIEEGVEDELFPVPTFPAVSRIARPQSSKAAQDRARDLDSALWEIDQRRSP